jgi:hypothetical protein
MSCKNQAVNASTKHEAPRSKQQEPREAGSVSREISDPGYRVAKQASNPDYFAGTTLDL